MSLLYPRLSWTWLPAMIGYAVIGSLFAGAFGILHDQITYSISPEYFARFKVTQFQCTNLSLPAFVHAANIHNAGYIGAITGRIVAIWRLKRMKGNPDQLVKPIA